MENVIQDNILLRVTINIWEVEEQINNVFVILIPYTGSHAIVKIYRLHVYESTCMLMIGCSCRIILSQKMVCDNIHQIKCLFG